VEGRAGAGVFHDPFPFRSPLCSFHSASHRITADWALSHVFLLLTRVTFCLAQRGFVLPHAFLTPQLRGMNREASWDKAAQEYEQIVNWALMDPPYCR
jgi:hypothetical protein